MNRIVEGAQHFAVERGRIDLGEIFGDGLAGDGECITVQQPGLEQGLHDRWHASVPVDVVHDVLSEGLQVANVGNGVTDAVEVVECELDLCFTRYGEQVQHHVC